jgi:hypothetical protein
LPTQPWESRDEVNGSRGKSAATRTSASERTSLLVLGWLAAFLAVLHLADHALRGERVRSHGLSPNWDHSGWPFKSDVTPYTFSLIAAGLLLGIGPWGTYRGKLRAGYWLATAVALGALVRFVHFIPTAHQESANVMYRSWIGLDAVGIAAFVNTFAIVAVLLLMAANAIRVGVRTGRWW